MFLSRCQSLTQYGTPCARNAMPGHDRCAAHRTDRGGAAALAKRLETAEKKISQLIEENAMLAKGLVELTLAVREYINGPQEVRGVRSDEEA